METKTQYKMAQTSYQSLSLHSQSFSRIEHRATSRELARESIIALHYEGYERTYQLPDKAETIFKRLPYLRMVKGIFVIREWPKYEMAFFFLVNSYFRDFPK